VKTQLLEHEFRVRITLVRRKFKSLAAGSKVHFGCRNRWGIAGRAGRIRKESAVRILRIAEVLRVFLFCHWICRLSGFFFSHMSL